MKDCCNECRYKMERHGIIEGEDVYYCDICGIYQTYPLEEEALLAAEKKTAVVVKTLVLLSGLK